MILKPDKTFRGYLLVRLSKNGIKKAFSIHRLVSMAFIKNFDGKNVVHHIDGVKTNNIVDNLEWVTTAENTIRAYKSGLISCQKGKKKSIEHIQKIRETPHIHAKPDKARLRPQSRIALPITLGM